MKERIQALAAQHFEKTRAIRRHLHQHPELSFEEEATGQYIAAELERLGIPHTTGWAGHGVVGHIGPAGGRVIALRADIDALPIRQESEQPYRSQNDGVMHACGHDVHTASLLGVAAILKELEGELPGQVRLIFQPGEEKLPGGASIMIKEGVLEDPVPELILGQHVHPPLEAGKVGIKGGPYMASADELYMTIEGKGGHGALPHECVDPIVVASQVVVALQQVVSRKAPPTSPSVLTFGRIASDGGTTNVIPDRVRLEGTFRAMDEAWRARAHEEITRIAEGTAAAMGATCNLEIRKGYPYLENEPSLTAQVREGMIEYLGAERVVDLPIRMTAEDFSYYSQVVDACFYRLGTGNRERGITSPVHTPTFDIDEKALETGIGTMAYLAISMLTKSSTPIE